MDVRMRLLALSFVGLLLLTLMSERSWGAVDRQDVSVEITTAPDAGWSAAAAGK